MMSWFGADIDGPYCVFAFISSDAGLKGYKLQGGHYFFKFLKFFIWNVY